MEPLLQDLRFAARVLWRDKGFTVTALLTLAICIGANTAIFAVVHSVLLRPLPFPEPDRIMLMYNSYPGAGADRGSSGVPDYYDRVRDVPAFEVIALYQQSGRTIGIEGSPERVPALSVTPSFFRLIRASAAHGRLFRDDEGEIGNHQKVILSAPLWKRLYGGAESALGKDLRISGVPHTIVGIMPEGFQFPTSEAELWTPLAFTPQQKSDEARHSNSWTMIGRLTPSATRELAQQQIDALNVRNLEIFPALKQILIDAGFHTVVVPFQEDLVRDIGPILYLLWGGVAFVLLIGCVNITNLVLVRASGRVRELATRHSLGAGYGRIARQLLTETTLLTAGGAAAGLLLGRWTLGLLALADIEDLPRSGEIQMDGTVVAVMLGVALLVGLAVGLIPLASVLKLDLNSILREEGRGGTSSRRARLARRALVTAQVAFAFVLLIGAGLLFASFRNVVAVDPGFSPAGVQTATINLPGVRYADAAALRAFASRLLDGVRRIPGVRRAGFANTVPLTGGYSDSVIIPEGYVMQKGESLISPHQITVSDGYFETMEIGLVRGRFFNTADTDASPAVVIVDERLAARFWPGTDPIGRRMFMPEDVANVTTPGPNTRWLTVVGVVETVKLTGLVETEARLGAYYFPYDQSPTRGITVVARTANEPSSLVAGMRRVVTGLDPELPIFRTRTMEEWMAESLVSRRLPMLLALGFAAVALFLSAIGIYGVLAYQVSQRRREIGIRMALGSSSRAIFGLVLGEGVQVLAIGMGLGIAGAFAVTRAMQGLLYDVSPMEPTVIAAVALILGVVALAAAVVPAQRAMKIDPVTALAD
jgi:predicted permease